MSAWQSVVHTLSAHPAVYPYEPQTRKSHVHRLTEWCKWTLPLT